MVIKRVVLATSFLEYVHSVISEHEDEQDTWADKREYAVHPFPINPQDILDVGGEIEPDFEEFWKKHDLTIEDLSTCSNWQTGLPWIRLGTEDMPLSLYQSLTIYREVEELIEEECFKEIALLPELWKRRFWDWVLE